MVWDSHLFKNIPQFVVMHIIKGFSIVNEAEEDFFGKKKKKTIKRNSRRQGGCLRRLFIQLKGKTKGKGGRERYTKLNAEFQRKARTDFKKSLLM